jgi:predicted transcriptional regulator
MQTLTFKDKLVELIKANPGKTSFDLKCLSCEPLTSSLTSKMNATLRTLVDEGAITRTHIDHTRPHLGYHFWYNDNRIPPAPKPISERSAKAKEKLDWVLNEIETKPGITSSRLRSQFAILGFGDKNSVSTILEKLLADKLIQRRSIQAGNQGAGYFYWPADMEPTHLPKPTVQRKSIVISSKPAPGPVAQFPAVLTMAVPALDTTQANVEIAIRLCEIEAYRNPDRYDAFMACAEHIRQASLKAA